jgi:cell wall-associated NlpC family hydrolase
VSGLPARLAAAAGCALLLMLVVVQGAFVALLGGGGAEMGCSLASLHAGANAPDLTGEQAANATTIIQVASDLRLPHRAAIIAIASALQESGLRNLEHGDRDSLGLFQQRPSQGWGEAPSGPGDRRSPAQRVQDPQYAATAFYTALRAVSGWEQMPLTVAAQTVQRSAYPDAYARWETLAEQTVTALAGQSCLDSIDLVLAGTGPAAVTAIAYARAQLGLPYEGAGDGPAGGDRGFDCSGLTHAAYEAAGIAIPRNAQEQFKAGPGLPAGVAPRAGDLVFFGTGPTNVTHVGILVSDTGFMIDAPHTGARIRLEKIGSDTLVGYTRPAAR